MKNGAVNMAIHCVQYAGKAEFFSLSSEGRCAESTEAQKPKWN